MITIKSNAEEVSKKLGLMANGMVKANVQSIKDAQKMGLHLAKSMAPIKTGHLKQGIFKTPIQIKGSDVSGKIVSIAMSRDKHKFPYNFWVNETIPAINLFGKGKMRTYRSMNTTGVAGYWSRTAGILQSQFPNLVIKEHVKNLKKYSR